MTQKESGTCVNCLHFVECPPDDLFDEKGGGMGDCRLNPPVPVVIPPRPASPQPAPRIRWYFPRVGQLVFCSHYSPKK